MSVKYLWNAGTKLVLAILLLHIAVGRHSVRAQITSIAEPFPGAFVETWEEYPVANPGSPATIFGGMGSISGDNPFVWMTTYILGTPGGLGLGPFPARAFDGEHGYATSVSPGSAHITFQSPVTDLGGYWAYAVDYPPAAFSFYDSQGALIGNANFVYKSPNNNGSLEWQGWHSSVPISSVDYTGHWVANDSLRITLVPEPSSSMLLTIGLLALAWNRLTKRA